MSDIQARHSDHPIDPLFIERWSPRAFTGEEMPEAELMTLFEAARWAPSSGNVQPWRFIYARRGTRHFGTFVALLNERNQIWARNASVLIVLVSSRLNAAGAASYTHSLDAGAAWQSLALQATRSGWHTHGMAGVDMERAARELGVPDSHRVEQAIAVGRKGERASLPEALAAREAPSGRLPLSRIVMEGGFRADV